MLVLSVTAQRTYVQGIREAARSVSERVIDRQTGLAGRHDKFVVRCLEHETVSCCPELLSQSAENGQMNGAGAAKCVLAGQIDRRNKVARCGFSLEEKTPFAVRLRVDEGPGLVVDAAG